MARQQTRSGSHRRSWAQMVRRRASGAIALGWVVAAAACGEADAPSAGDVDVNGSSADVTSFDADGASDDADGANVDSRCVPVDLARLVECLSGGASCEPLGSAECDDGDYCTLDLCAGEAGCDHVALPCRDGDWCTVDSCQVGVGCQYEELDCVDGNACTVDECLSESGCVYTAMECSDGDACTVDLCDPTLGCAALPLGCDDELPCTVDTCEPASGCEHAPDSVVCDDGNPCLLWSCELAVGCVFAELDGSCEDSDPCVQGAACLHGMCQGGQPLSCNDGDECTEDACNAEVGCEHLAVECNDADACTVDTCKGAGLCVHVALDCNDGDACTEDSCNSELGCDHKATSCKDDDPCTIESCDALLGCQYVSLCDDSNACTEDVCAKQGECSHEEINCEDGSVCTSDACDPELGCTLDFVMPSCNQVSECLAKYCHPLLGCMTVESPCYSDDPCQEPAGCAGGCLFQPRDCSDNNPCTLDACEPQEGCVHFKHNPCDDGNTATKDQCVNYEGCQFEVLGEPICVLSGEQGDELVCSIELVKPADGDSPFPTVFPASLQGTFHWDNQQLEFLGFETDLTLPTGDVVSLPIPPNPLSTGHSFVTTPPFLNGSNAQGQVLVAIVHFALPWTPLNGAVLSDEGTIVAGDPEIFRARFRLLATATESAPATVRLAGLAAGGTDSELVILFIEGLRITQERHCATHADCEDGDPCTIDLCTISGDHYCGHGKLELEDVGIEEDPCLIYTCNPVTGEFDTEPRVCDDGDACTENICTGTSSCAFEPIDPDDGDACTADFCDSVEGVFHLPAYCNDLNACTMDQCVPGLGCINTMKACDDGASCTTDACVKGVCEVTANHTLCDDDDPDTQDYCAPELPDAAPDGCIHVSDGP